MSVSSGLARSSMTTPMPSSKTNAQLFGDTQNVSPYAASDVLANILRKENADLQKITLVGDKCNRPWVAWGQAQAKKAVEGTGCPEVEHTFLSGKENADFIIGKKLHAAVTEAIARGILSSTVFIVLSSDNDFRMLVEDLRRLGARIVGGNAVFPPSFSDAFYMHELSRRTSRTKMQHQLLQLSRSRPKEAAQDAGAGGVVARENYNDFVRYKCEPHERVENPKHANESAQAKHRKTYEILGLDNRKLQEYVVELRQRVATLRDSECNAHKEARCYMLQNASLTALDVLCKKQEEELHELRQFKRAALEFKAPVEPEPEPVEKPQSKKENVFSTVGYMLERLSFSARKNA